MAKKSDASRAFSEDGALKTHVGGQALIEGIMMRGKYNWSVAVRQPNGQVYTEEHDLASGRKKNGWMYWPLVRGCRAMVESLALGFKALEIAATHAFDESAGQADTERAKENLHQEELEAVLLDNAFEDEFGDGASTLLLWPPPTSVPSAGRTTSAVPTPSSTPWEPNAPWR